MRFYHEYIVNTFPQVPTPENSLPYDLNAGMTKERSSDGAVNDASFGPCQDLWTLHWRATGPEMVRNWRGGW
jgi:hypothetical protein